MANEKNLRPSEYKLSQEEAKRGGIASGKARREKKTVQKLLEELFEKPCKDNPQFRQLASKLGLNGEESIKQLFILVCTLNTLKKGKLDDLQALCGLLGERTQSEANTTPAIEELAKSLFGDSE